MKILVVCMKHTYGNPARELSFEYFNFYQVLADMGHEVELFDYMGELCASSKAGMNQKLLERVRKWRPAVAVFSLYTDQFEPETVDALREYTKTFCFSMTTHGGWNTPGSGQGILNSFPRQICMVKLNIARSACRMLSIFRSGATNISLASWTSLNVTMSRSSVAGTLGGNGSSTVSGKQG